MHPPIEELERDLVDLGHKVTTILDESEIFKSQSKAFHSAYHSDFPYGDDVEGIALWYAEERVLKALDAASEAIRSRRGIKHRNLSEN